MDETGLASVIAVGAAVISLLAAGVAVLLRDTRGVPARQRIGLMVKLAASAGWSIVPPRWAVKSVLTGFLTFAAILLAGFVITSLIVSAIIPERPPPTEAYETFGDAMIGLACFAVGMLCSLGAAAPIGILVGQWVAARLTGSGSAPEKLEDASVGDDLADL